MLIFITDSKVPAKLYWQQSPAILIWPDGQSDPVAAVITPRGTFQIPLTDTPMGLYPIVVAQAYTAEWYAGTISVELDCPYLVTSEIP